MNKLADELEALAKKATPAPWQVDNFACPRDYNLRIGEPDKAGMPRATIAMADHNWDECGPFDRRISWAEAEANAALMAAMRTNLPTIIAALRTPAPAQVMDAVQEAADKAFDISFRGDTEGRDEAMPYIFTNHLALGRDEAEREIVAWLLTAKFPYVSPDGLDDGTGSAFVETCKRLADAIERGDHHTKGWCVI